jgi:hypothetical protein
MPQSERVIEASFKWPVSAPSRADIRAQFSSVRMNQRASTGEFRITGLESRVREVLDAIFTDKGMMEMILMEARVIRR